MGRSHLWPLTPTFRESTPFCGERRRMHPAVALPRGSPHPHGPGPRMRGVGILTHSARSFAQFLAPRADALCPLAPVVSEHDNSARFLFAIGVPEAAGTTIQRAGGVSSPSRGASTARLGGCGTEAVAEADPRGVEWFRPPECSHAPRVRSSDGGKIPPKERRGFPWVGQEEVSHIGRVVEEAEKRKK